MHETIKENIDKDLQTIRSALQAHESSDKYPSVVQCLARTYPKQQNMSDFITYPQAFTEIKQILGFDIDQEMSSAMSDMNSWLVGKNHGYDRIESELSGTDPMQDAYNYLIVGLVTN